MGEVPKKVAGQAALQPQLWGPSKPWGLPAVCRASSGDTGAAGGRPTSLGRTEPRASPTQRSGLWTLWSTAVYLQVGPRRSRNLGNAECQAHARPRDSAPLRAGVGQVSSD